jgi:hypothetical protein
VLHNRSKIAAHAGLARTHAGDFFVVAPTGRRLSWREVHVFDVRDGQIVEHWMDAALLGVYMQMIAKANPTTSRRARCHPGSSASTRPMTSSFRSPVTRTWS